MVTLCVPAAPGNMDSMTRHQVANEVAYVVHRLTTTALWIAAVALIVVQFHTDGWLPISDAFTARVAHLAILGAIVAVTGIAAGGLHWEDESA